MSLRIDPQVQWRPAQQRRTGREEAPRPHRGEGEAGGETAAAPPRPAGEQDAPAAALPGLAWQAADLQDLGRRLQEAAQSEIRSAAPDPPPKEDPEGARRSAEDLRRLIEVQAQTAARVQARGLTATAVNLLA